MSSIQRGRYGFGTSLGKVALSEAITRVTDALGTEGFGVLTSIDVQATLKKKLDANVQPYVILGACNPTLAKRALEADPQIGLLLPCNVVVREAADGQIEVSIADPKAMFAFIEDPAVAPVAAEALERLERVANALSASRPTAS